jgi:hypothetical protein
MATLAPSDVAWCIPVPPTWDDAARRRLRAAAAEAGLAEGLADTDALVTLLEPEAAVLAAVAAAGRGGGKVSEVREGRGTGAQAVAGAGDVVLVADLGGGGAAVSAHEAVQWGAAGGWRLSELLPAVSAEGAGGGAVDGAFEALLEGLLPPGQYGAWGQAHAGEREALLGRWRALVKHGFAGAAAPVAGKQTERRAAAGENDDPWHGPLPAACGDSAPTGLNECQLGGGSLSGCIESTLAANLSSLGARLAAMERSRAIRAAAAAAASSSLLVSGSCGPAAGPGGQLPGGGSSSCSLLPLPPSLYQLMQAPLLELMQGSQQAGSCRLQVEAGGYRLPLAEPEGSPWHGLGLLVGADGAGLELDPALVAGLFEGAVAKAVELLVGQVGRWPVWLARLVWRWRCRQQAGILHLCCKLAGWRAAAHCVTERS